MSESKPLICGDCLVDVVGRVEADGKHMVRCPSCGKEDTLDNAIREASEHKLHEILGGMFDGLKSTGAIKVRVTGPSERRFGFITADD